MMHNAQKYVRDFSDGLEFYAVAKPIHMYDSRNLKGYKLNDNTIDDITQNIYKVSAIKSKQPLMSIIKDVVSKGILKELPYISGKSKKE